MKCHISLTEKRMSDKRFRKTEEAILKVFLEEDYYICTKDLAKKVGVARSTIYNHHRAVREILPDYERYVLRRFKRILKISTKNKRITLKGLYFKILLLMVQEKKIFRMLVKNGRREVLEKIMLEIEGKIGNYARLPKKSEKMFKVYTNEVAGLIIEWGKRGFIEDEIEELLRDIMNLTDTMRQRLVFLIDQEN